MAKLISQNPVKRGNDPRPTQDFILRKIAFVTSDKNKLKGTFWKKNEDRLMQEEKNLKINWGILNEYFQDEVEIRKKNKLNNPTHVDAKKEDNSQVKEEFYILDKQRANNLSIAIKKFNKSPSETKEMMTHLHLNIDQVYQ